MVHTLIEINKTIIELYILITSIITVIHKYTKEQRNTYIYILLDYSDVHAVFACWATSNAYYSNTIIIIAVLAWYIILTESEEEDDQNHERKTLFAESYLIDIVLFSVLWIGTCQCKSTQTPSKRLSTMDHRHW